MNELERGLVLAVMGSGKLEALSQVDSAGLAKGGGECSHERKKWWVEDDSQKLRLWPSSSVG